MFTQPAPASRSAGVATGRMKLAEHAMDEAGRGRWCLGVLVAEIERLPLVGAELMEGLHLNPLDISHGRNELGDAIDIWGVIRAPRNQGPEMVTPPSRALKAGAKLARRWITCPAGMRVLIGAGFRRRSAR